MQGNGTPYLDEWFPIVVTIKNQENSLIQGNCEIDIKPTENKGFFFKKKKYLS